VSSTDEPATAAEVLAIPPGLDASLALLRHGETEYIVEGRFQGQR
jgi:hypothetical protein